MIEEPTSLPAHHIYQGGSAPSVECANCSAGATSGSWRRGWELEDKSNANLCNRCGQRWVKLGKALAKNGFAQAAAIVDPPRPRQAGPPPRTAPPSAAAGGGATTPLHAGTKRHFSLLNTASLTSYTNSRLAQRRASTATMRSRLRSETTSETSEGAGLSGNDDSPPHLPSHGPQITPVVGSMAIISPSQLYPSQNYAPKYSLQKMADGRTTYALFWVLGSRASGGFGAPILAVAGIDSRSSGHFSYLSVPGNCPSSSAPLRCTSRADVISWLVATMGVDPRAKPVPESSARLPLLTVPALLRLLGEDAASAGRAGGYTPTPPIGQLPLADSPFVSPTVALGSPSKLDRGAKIKPGFSAGGGFHSGAVVANKNQSTTTPSAATPKDLHNSSLPRFRCGACGRDDHVTDDCLLSCVSPPTLIHNPGTDIHTNIDALLLPVVARNGGNGGRGHEDNELGLDLLFGNGDEDSPMQDTAFDSFLDISFGPGGALLSPSGEPSPGAVTQPVRRIAQNNTHPMTTKTAAVVGTSPMPPPPAQGQFSQQKQQQSHQQQVSKDAGLEDTIRDWAVTLGGNISESLPCTQGGGRWVPLGEALAILHHLSMLDLSLEILEKTQISRAVAMLRNHNNLSVASAAHALAARWHQYAVAALQNANNYHHLDNNTMRIS